MSKSGKVILVVVGILALVLVVGGGVAYASDSAVPGEPLYAVDLVVEDMQRSMTTDVVAQADFEMDVLDERMDELEQLEAAGEDIEDVMDEVELQQDRVQERVREMEEDYQNDGVGEADRNRVVERYEYQLEEHLEYMYQLQEQNQVNKEDDSETEDSSAVEDMIKGYEEAKGEVESYGAGEQESGGDAREAGMWGEEYDTGQSNSAEDAGQDDKGNNNE